jgi:hypothetical protein
MKLFADLTNHVEHIKEKDTFQYDSLKIFELENQLNVGLTKLICGLDIQRINNIGSDSQAKKTELTVAEKIENLSSDKCKVMQSILLSLAERAQTQSKIRSKFVQDWRFKAKLLKLRKQLEDNFSTPSKNNFFSDDRTALQLSHPTQKKG